MGIEQICNEWLLDLANDMRKAINDVVKHRGEESDLAESVKPSYIPHRNGNITLKLSMNDYWYWLDKGRKPTKNSGDGAVKRGVSKDWQTQKGMHAKEIIIDIYRKNGLKLPKRGITYDEASRRLAGIIARKIHRKGYKARPFFDKVFNDDRLQKLVNALKPVMKEEFILELKK